MWTTAQLVSCPFSARRSRETCQLGRPNLVPSFELLRLREFSEARQQDVGPDFRIPSPLLCQQPVDVVDHRCFRVAPMGVLACASNRFEMIAQYRPCLILNRSVVRAALDRAGRGTNREGKIDVVLSRIRCACQLQQVNRQLNTMWPYQLLNGKKTSRA